MHEICPRLRSFRPVAFILSRLVNPGGETDLAGVPEESRRNSRNHKKHRAIGARGRRPFICGGESCLPNQSRKSTWTSSEAHGEGQRPGGHRSATGRSFHEEAPGHFRRLVAGGARQRSRRRGRAMRCAERRARGASARSRGSFARGGVPSRAGGAHPATTVRAGQGTGRLHPRAVGDTAFVGADDRGA